MRQYEDPQTLQTSLLAERDRYFEELQRALPLFRSVSRFEDLPVLDKAFISMHRQELMNPAYRGRTFRKKTGGSTGAPLVYMTGTHSQSYLWAGILLSWEAAGFEFGDRIAFLAGSALFGSGWKQRLFYRLMNVTLFSAFDLSPSRLTSYVDDLAAGQFRLIYGYASAIHVLAQHILNHRVNIKKHKLKAIVCTAELLTPAMREDIEAAFEVPCFNQYGCQDAGVSAFECEYHTGMHLISMRSFTEVLSGDKFISTDLSNNVMFLPRYNTGDLVRMSARLCKCGRGLPLIKEIKGRQNEIVCDMSGHSVHAEFFSHLFREDPRVHAFQVIFDSDRLEINIRTNETDIAVHRIFRETYFKRINDALRFAEISFLYNEPFVTTANGKHKFVMRRPAATDMVS
jgi:phenylacetate-CoA ligase